MSAKASQRGIRLEGSRRDLQDERLCGTGRILARSETSETEGAVGQEFSAMPQVKNAVSSLKNPVLNLCGSVVAYLVYISLLVSWFLLITGAKALLLAKIIKYRPRLLRMVKI